MRWLRWKKRRLLKGLKARYEMDTALTNAASRLTDEGSVLIGRCESVVLALRIGRMRLFDALHDYMEKPTPATADALEKQAHTFYTGLTLIRGKHRCQGILGEE